MRLHRLSKRDARRLVEKLVSLGYRIDSSKEVTVLEGDGFSLYYVGKYIFVKLEEVYLPLVDESMNKEILEGLPCIVVDMGAVPHIANGADVMRPGVVEVSGGFSSNDIAVVRDERHKRALAICKTLVGSQELLLMERGKVAENVHYVGDKLWKATKKLLESV